MSTSVSNGESVSRIRVTSGEAFARENSSGESRVRSVEEGAERQMVQREVGPLRSTAAVKEGTSTATHEDEDLSAQKEDDLSTHEGEGLQEKEDFSDKDTVRYHSVYARRRVIEDGQARMGRLAFECGLEYRIRILANNRRPREVRNYGRNVVFYEDMFIVGFRIPLPSFYSAVLEYYGLLLNQVIINAWKTVVSYAMLYAYKGWIPSIGVLRELYILKDQRGFYNFYLRRKG